MNSLLINTLNALMSDAGWRLRDGDTLTCPEGVTIRDDGLGDALIIFTDPYTGNAANIHVTASSYGLVNAVAEDARQTVRLVRQHATEQKQDCPHCETPNASGAHVINCDRRPRPDTH